MRDWITTVSSKLYKSDSLEPKRKLCSAMIVLCCLHLLQKLPNFQHIKEEEVLLNLLRMAALSPSGKKDYEYVLGMMPQTESRSVHFSALAMKAGLLLA